MDNQPDSHSINRLYFIGIGGIGMSALARYFHHNGAEVFGYDRVESPLCRSLVREGMQIHYEESVDEIPPDVDLVVYTPAIPETHAELKFFRANGYRVLKRAEVLGEISRLQSTIAIAGTHGKTTTACITAHLLRSSGVDCTAFLGGIARNFNSNFVHGKSPWMVVEADEFDRSFLTLSPAIGVVLSIDPDHLDVYGTPESMLETGFQAFVDRILPDGQLWKKEELPLKRGPEIKIGTFGLESGMYSVENIRVEGHAFVFDLFIPEGEKWKNLQWGLPGAHNIENALAAIAVARQLGATERQVREGLASFQGIHRRFEWVLRDGPPWMIDDYAHHPTELSAAIKAARMLFDGKKICGLFQPHLYTRTRDFAEGFAEALSLLDEAVLLPIYPAREEPIKGVSSGMILDKMTLQNKKRMDKTEVLSYFRTQRPEVLLTLGAGDIDQLVQPLKEILS